MEEIKKCLICENTEFIPYLNCDDYFFTKEIFNIVKCKSCGFLFVNPRPDQKDLSKYYESPEYISHSGTNKGFVNSVYKKIRKYTHSKKLNLVSKYAKGNNILDIGCGSGELLSLFKNNGWEVLGIEPNQNARNFAVSEYKLDIKDESEISTIPDNSKDVITMWHVLEHVSELNVRVGELKRILKKDGTIFIAVPNCISYDANYYNKFWAAYDVPRHLYHFTPDAMKRLLEKFKFDIIEVLPMQFDSYYVSMLSEKYKTGRSNILKALYIGWKSNRYAKKDKISYSSLLYVIHNVS
jgi:2-polyprenyl-3-methyl-5-hydroxy-6-metoxy-1,4-benzoquinol methylase